MQKLIEKLCRETGISGDEGRVRRVIEKELEGVCELKTDAMGNLIATKRAKPGSKRVALFAHMDEVGFVVTHVGENGLLSIEPIGILSTAAFGRRVLVGDGRIPGAIGGLVWHHLEGDARERAPKFESMYVDIGAKNAAEALSLVTPGDPVAFDAPFVSSPSGRLMARALDDRIGCATLIELLRSNIPCELVGVFTCGEEHSLFGAAPAAFSTAPDIAVILETTTAGDAPGAERDDWVCALGCGPVVSFADRGTLYDRELYALARRTADELGLPCQTKEGVFGGNEARVVQRARSGCRVMAVSTPCRNLHSASCVADMADITVGLALLSALLPKLAAL